MLRALTPATSAAVSAGTHASALTAMARSWAAERPIPHEHQADQPNQNPSSHCTNISITAWTTGRPAIVIPADAAMTIRE